MTVRASVGDVLLGQVRGWDGTTGYIRSRPAIRGGDLPFDLTALTASSPVPKHRDHVQFTLARSGARWHAAHVEVLPW